MTIKILLCLGAEEFQLLPQVLKDQVHALIQPSDGGHIEQIAQTIKPAIGSVQMMPTQTTQMPATDAAVAAAKEPKAKRVRKPKDASASSPQPVPVQAPEFNPEQWVPTQPQAQPQAQMPTQPPPQSYMTGDVRVFPASTGHMMQQNMAYDITARAPIQIPGAQPGPYVPQLQNAPVQVVPAMTQFQSQQPAPGVVSVDQVRMMAMQLFRDQSRGGLAALQAALTASGVGSLQNLTEANALGLYQYLQRSGG